MLRRVLQALTAHWWLLDAPVFVLVALLFFLFLRFVLAPLVLVFLFVLVFLPLL
eukprot:COSAG05_NODE_2671_length_2779_cov_154.767164_4_plen_54_part_00